MRLIEGKHRSPRILVVDDEESIRLLLIRILEPLGYTVDVAADADAALEMMRQTPADVALCDIRMPGHDGGWLIERLQGLYPETAIVIATGMHELDPRLTLGPGVIGYVTKPFAAKAVRDIVTQALGSARSARPRTPLHLLEAPDEQDEM
jgi:CheY-like chemotaxis protein